MRRFVPSEKTLHIFAVWAFAVAKPVYDVFARSPDFFVVRGNRALDVVVLALVVGLLLPLLVAAIARLLDRFYRHATSLLIAILFAVAVGQFVSSWPAAVWLAAVAVSGYLGFRLYERHAPVRSALSFLAPAGVLFLLWFLFFSPVKKVVLVSEGQTDDATVVAPSTSRPIVWVIFDELNAIALQDRNGHIDSTRFPNFAQLARSSTWYVNATTTHSSTTLAVPTLLTGRVAKRNDLPNVTDHPTNVFTLLAGRYQFHVEEPLTRLCPESMCHRRDASFAARLRSLFNDGSVIAARVLAPDWFDRRLPSVEAAFSGFGWQGSGSPDGSGRSAGGGADDDSLSTAVTAPQRFLHFIKGVKRRGAHPTLNLAHVELPHVPWRYTPDGTTYGRGKIDTPGLYMERWARDQGAVRSGLQRFLLQTMYVDRLLGKLIARLKKVGLWNSAVIVVTADHGVSFHPGLPRRAALRPNVASIASVPLFIRYPGQKRGRRDQAFVTTTDVLPTVLHAAGVSVRGVRFDGRDIRRGARRTGTVSVRGYTEVNGRSISYGVLEVSSREFWQRLKSDRRAYVAVFGDKDGGRNVWLPLPWSRPAQYGDNVVRASTTPDRIGPRVTLEGSLAIPGVWRVPGHGVVGIRGRVEGVSATVASQTAVAVYRGRRLVSVAPVVRERDRNIFLAIVPPGEGGQSRAALALEVWVKSQGVIRATRQNVPELAGIRLVARNGQTWLVGERPLARVIKSGSVEGFVDAISVNQGLTVLDGWAVDRALRRPAQQIVVVLGERVIGLGQMVRVRRDIAQMFGTRKVAKSGWQAPLQVRLRGSDLRQLRVFALSGGSAVELKLWEPAIKRANLG